MLRSLLLCAALVLPGFAPGGARADDLADIKAAGQINIGIFEDFPPFASMNSSMQVAGYDVDVARAIGEALGVTVNLVPITGQTRIAALAADKVDVLLSLGYSAERAEALTFVAPYAPYYIAAFANKGMAVATPADLAGKSVAVNRGTLDDTMLTAAAPPPPRSSGSTAMPASSRPSLPTRWTRWWWATMSAPPSSRATGRPNRSSS